jgi:hypothetical protein
MTIEDALGPFVLPASVALAIVSVLALGWYVARRYPTAPKRMPSGIGIDGRPRRLASRRWLWAAPCVLVAVTALLCTVVVRQPPPDDAVVTTALVFLTIAEIAWLMAWVTDRQIELARGMTYRVAPARLFRALTPILVTIAVTLFLAIRPAS